MKAIDLQIFSAALEAIAKRGSVPGVTPLEGNELELTRLPENDSDIDEPWGAISVKPPTLCYYYVVLKLTPLSVLPFVTDNCAYGFVYFKDNATKDEDVKVTEFKINLSTGITEIPTEADFVGEMR